MGEHVVAGAGGHVLEGHVPELHRALGLGQHLLGGAGLILHGGLGVQHLVDTVGTGLGTGQLQQGHGHHHHAHKDLNDVVDEGLEVAQLKGGPHDHAAAEVQHRHSGAVEGQHHHRQNGDDAQTHGQGGIHQIVVGLLELFPLKIPTHKDLDHPNGNQIFLQGVVQAVDALLHDLKELSTHLHEDADGQHHEGNDHHQHQGQAGVEGKADGQGGHQHHRGTHQHTQAHGQHHGHGVDVVGHAGDEGGGREAVDVRKGELLHLVKEALAQVPAKTLAGKGGKPGGQHAAQHGHACQQQHEQAQLEDLHLVPGGDGGVHDL